MVRADLFSGSLAVCASLSEATISSFSLPAQAGLAALIIKFLSTNQQPLTLFVSHA